MACSPDREALRGTSFTRRGQLPVAAELETHAETTTTTTTTMITTTTLDPEAALEAEVPADVDAIVEAWNAADVDGILDFVQPSLSDAERLRQGALVA
jgi:hypothetical protein